MKAKAILWTYDKQKDNSYPVKIRITSTAGGRTKQSYIPIEFSVMKSQWDLKTGRVKSHPNAPAMNLKIVDKLNIIERNHLTGNNRNNITKDQKSFYWWFDERIKYSEKKFGIYHCKKLKNVLAKLKSYAPILSVEELNYKFLQDYELFLLTKGRINKTEKKSLHVNYVSDQLARIRTIVNELVKEGIIPYEKNPFLKFKISKKRTERNRLTVSQIKDLQNLIIPEGHDSVRLARDMFIFSFNTGGIRWGDLCRLKTQHIKNGRLIFVSHKTENERNIKLNDLALKIISRYKGGEFIFPTNFYSAKDDNNIERHKEDNSLDKRGSFFRFKLKLACKWAKIPEITYHNARHSIADAAINAGVDMRDLQGILGHSQIKTTEGYAKSLYSDKNDTALELTLSSKKDKNENAALEIIHQIQQLEKKLNSLNAKTA